MKRFLALFAALALLSVGGLTAVGLTLHGARDDMVITEELLYGSPSAASGITVSAHTHLDRRLLWTTAYTPGGAEDAKTEFSFYPTGKPQWSDYDPGFSLYTALDFSMGGYGTSERMRFAGPVSAIEAVAGRTQPHETHEEVLTLKDYCDIYPLSASLDYFANEEERVLADELTAYCAIPVPGNQKVRISVTKDEKGEPYSVSCYTEDRLLNFNCHSVVNDDAVYFTISQFIEDGMNAVLPERLLGIHRMSLTLDENEWFSYVENSLELAYPMDAAAGTVTVLTETEDGTRLLMVTENDDGTLLSVIDKATMKLLQAIPLSTRGSTMACLRREEGYLVAIFADGGFALITEEGGSLGIRFIGNFLDHTGLEWIRYEEMALAYDGSRLAAAEVGYRPAQEDAPYESCAVTLLVYDPTGLLYAGRYHSSADRTRAGASDGGNYIPTVEHDYEVPVTLSFQS